MKRLDPELLDKSKPIEKEKEAKARRTLQMHAGLFRPYSDVVGYGIGSLDGEPYIQVYVPKDRAKELEKVIPDKIGEYDVYYIEAGPFRALKSL